MMKTCSADNQMKTCLYCERRFKKFRTSLVCRKCAKTASMVHISPGLFTKGLAAVEAKRAIAASEKLDMQKNIKTKNP